MRADGRPTKAERRKRIATGLATLLADLHATERGDRIAERLCYDSVVRLAETMSKSERTLNPFDRLIGIMELKAHEARTPDWATKHRARNAILDAIADLIIK